MVNKAFMPIYAFFAKNALRREMLLVMSAKLFILFLIAKFLFAHPIDHALTTGDLAQHYIGAAPTTHVS